MPSKACPSCGTSAVRPGADAACAACGLEFADRRRPPDWVRNGRDLRIIARRQRIMIFISLGYLAVIAGWFGLAVLIPFPIAGSPAVLVRLAIVLHFLLLICAVQLARSLGVSTGMAIIFGLVLLFPIANIPLAMATNSAASDALVDSGVRVGLLGAPDNRVLWTLSRRRCSHCGYVLAGNVSGVCPECGRTVTAAQRVAIQKHNP